MINLILSSGTDNEFRQILKYLLVLMILYEVRGLISEVREPV